MSNPPAPNGKSTDTGEAHKSGGTTPVKDGARAPKLPHEHDESSTSQDSTPRRVIRQAHDDLERGLVDTDRGPVLDEVYEHHVRPGTGATRDRAAADPAGTTPGGSGGATPAPDAAAGKKPTPRDKS